MKPNHIKNLSANIIQLIINQVFGLVIFYLLSINLDKTSFGDLNWVLAILLTVFNVLSSGLDQLVIKKIANGTNAGLITGLFLNHVIISGLTFYVLLGLLCWLLPVQAMVSQLLLIVGLGKMMLYFSTPFKQLAAGKEQFRLLAKMSATSSLTKGILLIISSFFYKLNLTTAAIIFAVSDSFEFISTLYLIYSRLKVPVIITWKPKIYFALLYEALPQTGVVLFTSALARFDWIFIGIYLSSVKLAEYSFAYKAFEIATLPLLALAPLLLPRFVSIIKERGLFPAYLFQLLNFEIVVAVFIAMLFFLCWSPIVDSITAGKYGAVNSTVIMVLAICMPFMYFNNFAWSIAFSQNKLKLIFKIFAATFTFNVVGDIVLIPLFGNAGASFAYLAALLVQAVLFIYCIERKGLYQSGKTLLNCIALAALSILAALNMPGNILFTALYATLAYCLLLVVTGQLTATKIKPFILLFR